MKPPNDVVIAVTLDVVKLQRDFLWGNSTYRKLSNFRGKTDYLRRILFERYFVWGICFTENWHILGVLS